MHHETTIKIVINERKYRGYIPFTCIGPIFSQRYIIPSNSSFQSSSGENKRSCKLMAVGQKQFFGDTMNIFRCQDHNFHWSREYSYYSSCFSQNEVICTYGIARAGCAPEFFDCKEVVSWCTEKYISSQRIFPLWDHSPVPLSPHVFPKMLKLSAPTLTFKV
jgi:hypothetical protein